MEKVKKKGKVMKKVLVLYLILFHFSAVFSQDFTKEYDKKILKIDSLQNKVIKPLNDSIIKLNSTYKSEISKFEVQIKNLENDTLDLIIKVKNLESQIAKLNVDKVKVERDSLKIMVDSLSVKVTEFKKLVSQKEVQIEKEKQIGRRNSREEKDKGKKEVLYQIIQFYNKPFDKLILSSTISSVDHDFSIVGNNLEVREKLIHLQKYFLAKQVLSEKYNEQEVDSALSQISRLDQTEFVKNMTDLLSNYKLCNSALKTTIENILEIDNQFDGNDDTTQEFKLNLILPKLAWYLRNYRINFSDYPYLSNIVLEIMKQKQRDANTPISKFLDEL